ncbi:TetR family transcriptional regulator [Alkalibaculum sp. M08DMB]|uniref:TetR family transcriptional regulator n=1 Tax=Alkalibaculum sporogenes TaxID=2655001 RepID=A0A6A7K524_9FIRM|nr:TetR/AcrR family transcriptional regulator [Alkalibaculum sporogenes]MPW24471.1 TetR family transcriptional regulator [Alkalibaculum sporogenes]
MKNEQNKKTKKNLQKKALDLFETRGYDNVTIDQICKELGLTKGAFYHYFKSKSDILLKSQVYSEGNLMNFYNDRIHLPAQEQLRSIFDWYISYFSSDDFEKFNAFAKTQLEHYNKNYPITSITQRMILKNIVNKGIENKIFKKELDATEISSFIYTYISGLSYLWNANHGNLDMADELDKFYNKFLLPLLKP